MSTLANATHDTRAPQAWLGTTTSSTRFTILSRYLIGSRSSGVSSCLVGRCRHETERTLVPGYSFRKCVPTGVGSNLCFDASPLGGWLIRRSTPLCLFVFSTRKYFRAYSPSAGVSDCLQTLQWINR